MPGCPGRPPIVSIDFGASVNRGQPLGPDITAYTYRDAGQLGEGDYTIANSTEGLKGTNWHTTKDHTGNANGLMMVINSATLASEGVFYKKTVTGLCPNTTYELSAWLMNVMAYTSPNPNVTFRVSKPDGTLIRSYDSGELPFDPLPIWRQSGFFFTTDAEETVVISILNNAPSAAPGNDLALDDITFRACGSIIASGFNSGSQTSLTLCAGTSGNIALNTTVSTGYKTPAFQWQVNSGLGWADITGATSTSTNINYTNIAVGTYYYRLAVGEAANFTSDACRVFSPLLTVTVIVPIVQAVANAGNNKNVMLGNSVLLDGTVTGTADTYSWAPVDGLDDPTKLRPLATPLTTTVYTLSVFSSKGCGSITTDEVAVNVFDKLIIPNTFTPNGDGINDKWAIGGASAYTGLSISIFDRTGAMVYQSINNPSPWDGRLNGRALPNGVYYYLIDPKLGFPKLTGWVTIVR